MPKRHLAMEREETYTLIEREATLEELEPKEEGQDVTLWKMQCLSRDNDYSKLHTKLLAMVSLYDGIVVIHNAFLHLFLLCFCYSKDHSG